jgi:glycosyltransferase involved in cell wall biosynthesis
LLICQYDTVAQLSLFVLSPSTLLSAIGLMRGADRTPATPAEDWRDAKVDVIIPALNERDNIVRCLDSLIRQTRRPRHIVVVDDGSVDDTAERALAFCRFHRVSLILIPRKQSVGKTPTIKEHARELDSDVLFVLDADTVLESDNYIERVVQDLYQGIGIASACGSILPLRERDRRLAEQSPRIRAFIKAYPWFRSSARKDTWRRIASGATNMYREVLYLFLQRFVYRGQMAIFGTLANPAGCAVAYRRKYLEALFDYVEPRLGDDLTNSEDIFIGLAMLDHGYRNIQVTDVCARTVEPEVQRLSKQLYMWSSAFLQSVFYFDAFLKSPFKTIKRWWRRRRPRGGWGGGLRSSNVRQTSMAYAAASGTPSGHALMSVATPLSVPGIWRPSDSSNGGYTPAARGERRQIREPYRQAFGREHTKTHGRPAGWAVMTAAIEKIGFPTALVMMALCRNWESLLITVCAESLIVVAALTIVMKGRRLEYLLKGIAVTPIRYFLLVTELTTIARFATDVWFTKNRRWRK